MEHLGEHDAGRKERRVERPVGVKTRVEEEHFRDCQDDRDAEREDGTSVVGPREQVALGERGKVHLPCRNQDVRVEEDAAEINSNVRDIGRYEVSGSVLGESRVVCEATEIAERDPDSTRDLRNDAACRDDFGYARLGFGKTLLVRANGRGFQEADTSGHEDDEKHTGREVEHPGHALEAKVDVDVRVVVREHKERELDQVHGRCDLRHPHNERCVAKRFEPAVHEYDHDKVHGDLDAFWRRRRR
ncbi:hypothetical protein BC831DRAFT_135367 [Entophlyctis helioformis]|nr:hypothetical protein BC831DRAFT_135367 [Entophlyctis helioformis]